MLLSYYWKKKKDPFVYSFIANVIELETKVNLTDIRMLSADMGNVADMADISV